MKIMRIIILKTMIGHVYHDHINWYKKKLSDYCKST